MFDKYDRNERSEYTIDIFEGIEERPVKKVVDKRKEKEMVRKDFTNYEAIAHKDGFIVQCTQKGGKHNKIGKVTYCDAEKFFVSAKNPLRPIAKNDAEELIQLFQKQDWDQKRMLR